VVDLCRWCGDNGGDHYKDVDVEVIIRRSNNKKSYEEIR